MSECPHVLPRYLAETNNGVVTVGINVFTSVFSLSLTGPHPHSSSSGRLQCSCYEPGRGDRLVGFRPPRSPALVRSRRK